MNKYIRKEMIQLDSETRLYKYYYVEGVMLYIQPRDSAKEVRKVWISSNDFNTASIRNLEERMPTTKREKRKGYAS